MKIIVLLRMVPDVVEELEIAAGGKALDADLIRTIPGESDDHAVEQALLLKERHGGMITVIAPDAPEIDDALYTAFAKGVDRAVKIECPPEGWSAREAAEAFAALLAARTDLMPADLILTGVQSVGDLDGLVAPIVAERLRLPYVGIVTAVNVDPAGSSAFVLKEFPGGVRGEYRIPLPAVLGIQAAEKPPRYVPVARVRAAMKTSRIDSAPAPEPAAESAALIEIVSMRKPEMTGHAEMLEGDPEAVAGKICELLGARGLL
jgi:electron transfer flavoprotein beta subunit